MSVNCGLQAANTAEFGFIAAALNSSVKERETLEALLSSDSGVWNRCNPCELAKDALLRMDERARESFLNQLWGEAQKYSVQYRRSTPKRLVKRPSRLEAYLLAQASVDALSARLSVSLPFMSYAGMCGAISPDSVRLPPEIDERRATAIAFLQSLSLERKLRGTERGTNIVGWVIGILLIGAITGFLSVLASKQQATRLAYRDTPVQQPKPEPAVSAGPVIPAETALLGSTISEISPQSILRHVYGDFVGQDGRVSWPASALPPSIRSSGDVRDVVEFRVVWQGETPTDVSERRQFVVFGGTELPREEHNCHACSAILGILVLKKEGAVWRVESVARTLGWVGENGEVAESFRLVEWNAGQHAVVLEDISYHQGYEERSATIVGVWNEQPVVLAEVGLGASDCGAQTDEIKSCRDDTADFSFVRAEPNQPWELEIKRHVKSGLKPGESADTTERLRFDGTKFQPIM
jgi:hypothetical protein